MPNPAQVSRTRSGCIAGRTIAVAAMAALAIGVFTPASAQMAKKGGTMVIGVETDFRGFDALKARVLGVSASTAANVIMERLEELDGEGNLVPRLAISRQIADDAKSITLKLRQGVTFHDGTPFTADAVVQYYTRILDPKNRYVGLLFIYPLQSAEKVDDFTVRFNLRHPWLPWLRGAGTAHSFVSYIPSPKATEADSQNRQPVGTGPFIFEEWQPGNKFVVRKNPDYWDVDKIHLDRIVFRFLPDQQTRYLSLKGGEVDMIWTDRGPTILRAEQEAEFNTYKRDGVGAGIFFLNTAKPPLDDLRVRQAVSHAWDQKIFIKSSLKGTRPFITSPFGADDPCNEAGFLHHDVSKARELVKAYGKPVEIELIHTTTPRGREFGEILQQLLKKAGIKLTLSPVDQLQLRQRVFTKNYQISGWRIADVADVGPQLFALLYSKSPYNLTQYKNPAMDALVYGQRIEVDPVKRQQKLCKVSEFMNQQAMILYTSGRRHHAFAYQFVKNLGPMRQGVPDQRNLWLDK